MMVSQRSIYIKLIENLTNQNQIGWKSYWRLVRGCCRDEKYFKIAIKISNFFVDNTIVVKLLDI
jgi:hypothetical protein